MSPNIFVRYIAEAMLHYYYIFAIRLSSVYRSVSAIIPNFATSLHRPLFLLSEGIRLIKCTLTTEEGREKD